MRSAVLAVLFCLLTLPALAIEPGEALPDPALETRARTLSQELRCMVCQNQSIDDSDAPLARDLRLLVRQRLAAGDSDAQVLTFLTDRYGEFVLLRPSFTPHNLLLWAAPFLALAGGIAFLLLRRRNAAFPAPPPLSVQEEAEIAKLQAGDD